MKSVFVFIFASILLCGCTHYSLATRPETDNVINAPVDAVWDRTLTVLREEDVTVNSADKRTLQISARYKTTIWSFGDDLTFQLMPRGTTQTVLIIAARTSNLLFDWGHEKRLSLSLFGKIKSASEK
jgi:hypothetical protein